MAYIGSATLHNVTKLEISQTAQRVEVVVTDNAGNTHTVAMFGTTIELVLKEIL